MVTSSKRAYATPRDPTSSGDTQTQFCLSLCGVSGSWCAQGMFEPSEHLWWVWGLILNVISPLLPSCWGFSPTKVHLVKAMVFPVVMYGCKSWTIKKVERQRIDAFEMWCWRRLLRVPWTARRSNQSILKEISPEYSLEGLRLKLNSSTLAPDAKNGFIGKDLDAGKDWRQEKGTVEDDIVGWHHRLDGHEFE